MKIAGIISIALILILPSTHALVLLEVASNSSDKQSAEVNEELFNLYNSRRDFVYITMIGDRNEFAYDRIKYDYNFHSYPEIFFDGGYEVTENTDINSIINKIEKCNERDKLIDVKVNATWIECPCQRGLFIQARIKNVNNYVYNGTVRIYITEYNSRYDDYNGMQYHFGFLEFAYIGNVSIPPHEEILVPVSWDSKINFPDIDQDDINNLAVIAAVFNSTPHKKFAGDGTNPFNAYYEDAAAISIAPNTPPTVSIIYPKQDYLYISGREIMRMPYTIIIGSIDVDIYSYDSNGIEKIELYQDNEKIREYNGDFEWKGRGTHSLSAVAYDTTGIKSLDTITAFLL